MASKKDMRRSDLIIPYQEPVSKSSASDISSTMSSTMPMAAMFTRNRFIGWAAVVFSLQTWLSESPEQAKTASQPAYLGVGLSFMALLVTYLPLFLPPPGSAGGGTGTEAAAPLPPS